MKKEKNLKANFVGKNLIKNIKKRYLMVALNFMDFMVNGIFNHRKSLNASFFSMPL